MSLFRTNKDLSTKVNNPADILTGYEHRVIREKKNRCKTYSMKFNLTFNKSLFWQNLEFLLEFFGKIQEIEFLCCIFMDFLTQVFLFGAFPSII